MSGPLPAARAADLTAVLTADLAADLAAGRPYGVVFALLGVAALVVLIGLFALAGGRRTDHRNEEP